MVAHFYARITILSFSVNINPGEAVGLEEEVIKEVVKLALNQGIWAVLFVALLFYVLKNGEKRENRLVDERKTSSDEAAIREEKLMKHLENIAGVCKDVDQVKIDVGEMKQDIKILKDRSK